MFVFFFSSGVVWCIVEVQISCNLHNNPFIDIPIECEKIFIYIKASQMTKNIYFFLKWQFGFFCVLCVYNTEIIWCRSHIYVFLFCYFRSIRICSTQTISMTAQQSKISTTKQHKKSSKFTSVEAHKKRTKIIIIIKTKHYRECCFKIYVEWIFYVMCTMQ